MGIVCPQIGVVLWGLGPCTNKWLGCHCQNTMVSGPNGYRVAHNGVCCYGALGGCTIQWLVCHFQITKLQWPMAPMGIGVGALRVMLEDYRYTV